MKNDGEIAEHTNRKWNISETGIATNLKFERYNLLVKVSSQSQFKRDSIKNDSNRRTNEPEVETGSATKFKFHRDNLLVNVFKRSKFERDSMKNDRVIAEHKNRKWKPEVRQSSNFIGIIY